MDFENVHSDGLKGCSSLAEKDSVYIFYSDNAKNLNLDVLKKIGNAKLELYKIPVGNQSLDKHLLSFLGYLIGKGSKNSNYVVISKDTGYQNVVNFWKEQDYKVSLQHEIEIAKPKQNCNKKQQIVQSETVSKIDKKKKTKLNSDIQTTLSKSGYDNNVISDVASMVASCYGNNKLLNAVHNKLRDKYSNYQDIYKVIKPVLNQYSTAEQKPPKVSSDNKKASVKKEVRQILIKANKPKQSIDYTVSLIDKYYERKDMKQSVHDDLLSKYGQGTGNDLYNRIKNHL